MDVSVDLPDTGKVAGDPEHPSDHDKIVVAIGTVVEALNDFEPEPGPAGAPGEGYPTPWIGGQDVPENGVRTKDGFVYKANDDTDSLGTWAGYYRETFQEDLASGEVSTRQASDWGDLQDGDYLICQVVYTRTGGAPALTGLTAGNNVEHAHSGVTVGLKSGYHVVTDADTDPDLSFANGTGGPARVTWTLLRGCTGVPTFVSNATTSGDEFSLNIAGAGAAGGCVLSGAVVYKAGGAMDLARLSGDISQDKNRVVVGDTGPMSATTIGVALNTPARMTGAQGHKFAPVGLYANYHAELGGFTRYIGETIAVAGEAGTSPVFDTSVWKRENTEQVGGDLLDLLDLTFPSGYITLVPNRRQTITIDDEMFGRLPTITFAPQNPTDQTIENWMQVRVVIKDRRRHCASNADSMNYSIIFPGGKAIHHGVDPGSISTILYRWDPIELCWLVVDGWGDVIVRQHKMLNALTNDGEIGMRVWMSPEAATGADCITGTRLTVVGIPIEQRRRLGNFRCFMECGYTSPEMLTRWTYPAFSGGLTTQAGRGTSNIVYNALSDTLGEIILHEFGHLLDYWWLGGVPTSVTANGVTATVTVLTSHPRWQELWTLATTGAHNIPAKYSTGLAGQDPVMEYFAQLYMTQYQEAVAASAGFGGSTAHGGTTFSAYWLAQLTSDSNPGTMTDMLDFMRDVGLIP